jgi:hypothetical protein
MGQDEEEESEEDSGEEEERVEMRPAAPDWKQAFDAMSDPTAVPTAAAEVAQFQFGELAG